MRGGHNITFEPYFRPPWVWWIVDRVLPGVFGDPWEVLEGVLHNADVLASGRVTFDLD